MSGPSSPTLASVVTSLAQRASRLDRTPTPYTPAISPPRPRHPSHIAEPANTPLKLIGAALLVAPPRCGDAAKPRQQLSGTLAGPRRCRHSRWSTPWKTGSCKPRATPTSSNTTGTVQAASVQFPSDLPPSPSEPRQALFVAPMRIGPPLAVSLSPTSPGGVHRVPAYLPEPPALSHRVPAPLLEAPGFLLAAIPAPRSSSSRGDHRPQTSAVRSSPAKLARGVERQGVPSHCLTARTRSLRR